MKFHSKTGKYLLYRERMLKYGFIMGKKKVGYQIQRYSDRTGILLDKEYKYSVKGYRERNRVLTCKEIRGGMLEE